MTVTLDSNTATEDAQGAVGRVARVIGPVVDVEFPADQMPDIYNALLIDIDAGEQTRTIYAEVALHVGDNMVRAISLKPTDGMRRGARVVDTGPHGHHGTLVNTPTRAVCGARWTGQEHCFRHAPGQYGAIHFHDDDLHDCGWQDDFSFTIPKDMKSGIYGMQLTCGPHRDVIPFFVRPQMGKPQAKVCYLAATFTYQVYSNFARGMYDEAFRKKVADWKSYPNNPDEHKDYGLSTYNLHRDGSGVSYSSRLRPLLTWRPNYLSFNDEAGSGLRHLPADQVPYWDLVYGDGSGAPRDSSAAAIAVCGLEELAQLVDDPEAAARYRAAAACTAETTSGCA